MRQIAPRPGRRRILTGIGSAVAVGLAGCSGGGDGDGGDGDGGDGGGGGDGGDGDEETPTETATPTEASDGSVQVPELEPAGDAVGSEARGRVDEFLTDVGNFEGEIMDATGMDEVVVAVGAEGNGGNFAFRYPAVAVSPGTTASWQWTGQGAGHNVVSQDSSDFEFDSGDAVQNRDPFERTFDSAGVGLYVCVPHESLGMKGAVVVLSG
jgi:halocyanin-like protein